MADSRYGLGAPRAVGRFSTIVLVLLFLAVSLGAANTIFFNAGSSIEFNLDSILAMNITNDQDVVIPNGNLTLNGNMIKNATIESGLGSKSDPAKDCEQIQSLNADQGNGKYWIDPDDEGFAHPKIQTYCDFKYDGGGWTLVASNWYKDTTIPNGTDAGDKKYYITRKGASNPENTLGTASPESDYLMGEQAENLEFTEVRGVGWARGEVDQSTEIPFDSGYKSDTYAWSNLSFDLEKTGNFRFNETESSEKNGGSEAFFFTGGESWTVSSDANWCVLDGIKADNDDDGSFNANRNQMTVGATCALNTGSGVAAPDDGNYYGHGTDEGNEVGKSFEGVIGNTSTGSDNDRDMQGYTTWVR